MRPKYFSWFFLAATAMIIIGMFSSCRSAKRTVSREHTQRDSVSRTFEVGTKETNIHETTLTNVDWNPGDLSGEICTDDTAAQVIESNGYKLTVKPDGKGKAKVAVKGKDQKIPVPGEKTINIKEASAQQTQTAVHQKSDQVVKERTATGMPWYVWVGCVLMVAGIFAIIILLKFR